MDSVLLEFFKETRLKLKEFSVASSIITITPAEDAPCTL
jgi:hypothetical protein